MTTLTTLSPVSSFECLMTIGTSTTGLTSSLQQVGDGIGNYCPLYLSTISVNISTSMGPFEIDGVALTATASQINSVCGAAPAFPAGYPLMLPTGTTGTRPLSPTNGMIWYNTTTHKVEAYANGSWQNLTS